MGSFKADVELYFLVVLSFCLLAALMWYVMRRLEGARGPHAKAHVYQAQPTIQGRPVYPGFPGTQPSPANPIVPMGPTVGTNQFPVVVGTMTVVADMHYQITNVRMP